MIMLKKYNDIFERALHTYGADWQQLLAVGEIGELLTVLAQPRKRFRRKDSKLLSEITDVLIMMMQMSLMRDIDNIEERVAMTASSGSTVFVLGRFLDLLGKESQRRYVSKDVWADAIAAIIQKMQAWLKHWQPIEVKGMLEYKISRLQTRLDMVANSAYRREK